MSSSDPRDLLADLIRCFQTNLKRYDRGTRKKAWDALKAAKGRTLVDKIVDNPERPVVGIPRLLFYKTSFKEWYYASDGEAESPSA